MKCTKFWARKKKMKEAGPPTRLARWPRSASLLSLEPNSFIRGVGKYLWSVFFSCHQEFCFSIWVCVAPFLNMLKVCEWQKEVGASVEARPLHLYPPAMIFFSWACSFLVSKNSLDSYDCVCACVCASKSVYGCMDTMIVWSLWKVKAFVP